MSQVPPPVSPADPAPAVAPLTAAEWRLLLRRPDRVLDMLLGQHARFAAGVAAGEELHRPLLLLFAISVLAAVPYGFVFGSPVAVVLLYTGSLLICWPSLAVFAGYLGIRLRPEQSLVLALSCSAVAGLFTLGFAPIAAFLIYSMRNGDFVTGNGAALFLLLVALLAGLAFLVRCLVSARLLQAGGILWLMLGWLVLALFVTARMARELHLLP